MSQNLKELPDEELIEMARKRLPLPSQANIDECVIVLIEHENKCIPYTSAFAPPKTEVTVIEVFFRKIYSSGIAMGWEFNYLRK